MIPQIIDGLRDIGLSEACIWQCHYRAYRNISIFFEERGEEFFSEKTLSEYDEYNRLRLAAGTLSRETYKLRRKAAERLNDFYHTNEVRWYVRPKGTKFILANSYEKLAQEFVSQTEYSDNSKGDAIWAIRKYLCFIESKLYASLRDITLGTMPRGGTNDQLSLPHDSFL
jgi:hypothetical protein